VSRLGRLLATITGNIYLVFGGLFFAVLTILAAALPPRGWWPRLTVRAWARGVLLSAGIRVEAEYAPGLEPGARYVYLANHQSLYDIPVLLVSLPRSVRMVAKHSLFRIPVFGWSMYAGGFIPVDREDRSTARATFAAAESRLRGGGSLLLFPEGTRSTEDRLLPFQRGGFLLALKSGLPIVPVGVRGTRQIQLRGSRIIRPGVATVRFGEPLDPSVYGLRRKRELVAEVRRRIAELAGLPDEAESSGVPLAPGEGD
jgi:1-acyl-sn-glycerol-3-phosphate acyltransferase